MAGCDAASGLPVSVEVSSEDVCQALQPVLTELAKEVRQVLKDASPQLVVDVSGNQAVLIGGGANLPGLAEFLRRETHLAFQVPAQPELATRLGMDRALAEPQARRRLLAGDKPLLAPVSSGRLTEKLIGLAAIAMLLFASYFPADREAGGETPLASVRQGMAPFWLAMSSAFQPAAESQIQMAELKERDRRMRQLVDENKALRRATKSKAPAWVSWPSLPARVVARAPGSWSERLVVDAGRSQGVVPGMAAVSDRGLVGRVQSVADANSQVSLVSSTDNEMGGRVQRTKSAGVIRQGEDGDLEMRFLNPGDGIKKGDLVVTSGLDGLYPAGIPVAKVESVYRPNNEVAMAARLAPLPDMDSLEGVLLVGGPNP